MNIVEVLREVVIHTHTHFRIDCKISMESHKKIQRKLEEAPDQVKMICIDLILRRERERERHLGSNPIPTSGGQTLRRNRPSNYQTESGH